MTAAVIEGSVTDDQGRVWVPQPDGSMVTSEFFGSRSDPHYVTIKRWPNGREEVIDDRGGPAQTPEEIARRIAGMIGSAGTPEQIAARQRAEEQARRNMSQNVTGDTASTTRDEDRARHMLMARAWGAGSVAVGLVAGWYGGGKVGVIIGGLLGAAAGAFMYKEHSAIAETLDSVPGPTGPVLGGITSNPVPSPEQVDRDRIAATQETPEQVMARKQREAAKQRGAEDAARRRAGNVFAASTEFVATSVNPVRQNGSGLSLIGTGFVGSNVLTQQNAGRTEPVASEAPRGDAVYRLME